MFETRAPGCLPIFPKMNFSAFWCNFLNVGYSTYLVTDGTVLPKCCLFARPFHPPRRDFLRRLSPQVVAANIAWPRGGAGAECGERPCSNLSLWYQVPGITPPVGPFDYSYMQLKRADSANSSAGHLLDNSQPFLSFTFGGFPPSRYVSQQLSVQTSVRPDAATVFAVPAECKVEKLPTCEYVGVDEARYHSRFHPGR